MIAGDQNQIEEVNYWSVPFEQVDAIATGMLDFDPTSIFQGANGELFVTSNNGSPVNGEPSHANDWAYFAVVVSTLDDDTSYSVSPFLHKPLISVSVNWTARTNPMNANDRNPNFHDQHALVPRGNAILPEANQPLTVNGVAANPVPKIHDHLGVKLTYAPPIPAGFASRLWLHITDPDNVLDTPAQLPANASPKHDVNDQPGQKLPNDNYKSVAGYGAAAIAADTGAGLRAQPPAPNQVYQGGVRTLAVDVVSGKSSELRFFQIKDPQPGNNWHVVVHDNENVAKSITHVGGSEPGRTNSFFEIASVATEMLTVARTLWIEDDPMGDPNQAAHNWQDRGTFNGENRFGINCLANQCDDPLPKTANNPNGTALAVDMSVFETLISDAMVEVKKLPANFNTTPKTLFRHYGNNPSNGNNSRNVKSDQNFWVIQMVAAYEATPTFSNDPDKVWTANVGYGIAFPGDRSTYVYVETINDIRRDASGLNANANFRNNLVAIVSAHEATHRFVGPHGPLDVNLMDGSKALVATNPIEYISSQLQRIQTRMRPE